MGTPYRSLRFVMTLVVGVGFPREDVDGEDPGVEGFPLYLHRHRRLLNGIRNLRVPKRTSYSRR